MRIFLFTLFVSSFIGVSLFAAIRYTQTYIEPQSPLEKSVAVGHLDNLFAEKVSDTEELPEGVTEEGWEDGTDAETLTNQTVSLTTDQSTQANRGATERRAPVVEKKAKPKGTPRGKTDTKTHDFGSIDEGEVITHYFTVSNKGNAPLRIKDFEVGCGCTMVDFPRKSIQPGKSVKIKAVFDSKDKLGPQNKLVRLVTNGVPRNLDMYFKGYVYPKNFGKETAKEEETESKKPETPQEKEKAPADTSKKQVVKG